MKKRIIAILLSLSVFCCSLSCGKRASAAPVAVGGVALFILAANLLGVMTGQCDKTAQFIGDVLESGVDAFTNPDSWFQEHWTIGSNILPPSTAAFAFEQIRNTVESWFDNGELQIENGQIKLTYDQFHELYGQVVNACSNVEVEFHTDYNYLFLDVDLSKTFAGTDLPLINGIYNDPSGYGQAYASIFFNDNIIVFSDTFFRFFNNGASYFVDMEYIGADYKNVIQNGGCINSWGGPYTDKPSEFIKDHQYLFYFPSLSNFSMSLIMSPGSSSSQSETFHFSSSNCFVYNDGTLTYKPLSEVDTTGMRSGLVTTTGAYGDFMRSVKGYTPNLVPPANLDDLSDVLPTEYNPSLSFPVDPDLTRPLPNQVIVGDVPGVADLPLSEYQAEIKTEIEVPSIICTKFPFCIPYDFIRFLGLLCSDPVAPVFRIPISTSPDNLEQWSGNVTVNEYLNPDDLMFEIDEEIVIDLSVIPLVQPICYTCFIVGFIFLLLHITPKMIQH